MSLKQPPLDAAGFAAQTGVSRETLARLDTYLALLLKWQSRINLVGPSTLPDAWRRHFLDSAQLMPLLPNSTTTLVDFGSGAGFPGLVLAILGTPNVHLVESDHRKIAFLREVAAATKTPVTFHAKRIEAAAPISADVVTARALAPLAQLVDYAVPWLAPQGICLFLKGRQVETELEDALKRRTMAVSRFPSQSDTTGFILRLSAVSPLLTNFRATT